MSTGGRGVQRLLRGARTKYDWEERSYLAVRGLFWGGSHLICNGGTAGAAPQVQELPCTPCTPPPTLGGACGHS